CPVSSMLPTGVNPRGVRVVDLDLDGTPEIAVSNVSNVEIYRPGGARLYRKSYTSATGANPWEMDAADLNGDAFPDLVTANRFGQNVSVLLGLGRLFTQIGQYTVGAMPGLIAIGDLDHDAGRSSDIVLQTADAISPGM